MSPASRAETVGTRQEIRLEDRLQQVVEGDIKACFDEIDHTALMGRMRRRVGDNRVLGLVKAFLKAGILTEAGLLQDSTAGTPQGGILSPLLANVALSVLDEHIAGLPGGPATGSVERAKRLRHGQPNFRLVRYADDWCVMVRGTRAHRRSTTGGHRRRAGDDGVASVTGHDPDHPHRRGAGLPRVAHPASPNRGTSNSCVYVHPSTKAVLAVKRKIKTLRRTVEPNQPLDDLLRRVNSTLQGWAGYFRAGVSSATFSYLSHYTWQTVWRWLRRKHRKSTWKQLRLRYCGGWWPATEERVLIDLEKIGTTRYRYRGAVIPSPWPDIDEDTTTAA
jgi:RNA-directed DNA polymerase